MGMEDALIMTTQVEHAIKEWLKIRTQIQANKPEDEKYNPSAIAENYWKLYTQKKEDFEVELLY